MQNIFDEEPKPEDKYDLFKNDKPFVEKTLSRSKKDKVFLGICAGLADYHSVNPNLVRLLFALSILLGGLGAVIYLILFFFVAHGKPLDESEVSEKKQSQNKKALLGITLITVGFYFIVMPTNYFPLAFLFFIPTQILFPIVFLFVGIWIQKNYRSMTDVSVKSNFQRPIKGRLLLGVCVGLAQYLETFALVIRLLFVVFTFATFGVGIVIYFLIVLFSKQKRVVIIE